MMFTVTSIICWAKVLLKVLVSEPSSRGAPSRFVHRFGHRHLLTYYHMLCLIYFADIAGPLGTDFRPLNP